MGNWKKLLLAIDGTETSLRAVRYVGELAGCSKGIQACLLYVYTAPPPYYYREGGNLKDYQAEKNRAAQELFTTATNTLLTHGFEKASIDCICRMADKRTISETILEVQAEGDYGAVVLGKRGVSKAEEFLFGSISNTVTHACHNFTVWVVG